MHWPISSGILAISFWAMFSFLSSTSCPILGEINETLFDWIVNSLKILISNISSGILYKLFLSSFSTLNEIIALTSGEISSILFYFRSKWTKLGKHLQNSPSIYLILFEDKFNLVSWSNLILLLLNKEFKLRFLSCWSERDWLIPLA